MTDLRKMMLEELQRRNYSEKTTKAYLHTVWEFAKYFHPCSPDQLGPEHIREFQAHLFSVRKLSGNSDPNGLPRCVFYSSKRSSAPT